MPKRLFFPSDLSATPQTPYPWGFTLNEIKRNYWADGFDMYSMQYNEL